jgi:hypothetical protein
MLFGGPGVATADPASASPDGTRRLLVVVGSDVGLRGEAPLRHASSDARRVAEVFARLGGVAPADTTLLLTPDAASLELALDRARQVATASAPTPVTLVFYFSGHGDHDALHTGGDRLPLARIDALLEAVPARLRLSIIDACRSEDVRKGLAPAAGFTVDLQRASAVGALRLWSSAPGEAARESEALGGAVFTQSLLGGLAGAADTNGDRLVTLTEAYDHAFAQTIRRSATTAGPLQHPVMDARLAAEGAVVLTRIDPAAATLDLPPAPDQQYLVFARPAGTLVAEVFSDPERPRTVAVPPGRYLVQRRGSGLAGAANVTVSRGAPHALTDADFEARPLVEVVAKGGQLELDPHRVSSRGAGVVERGGARGFEVAVGYHARYGALTLGAAVTGRKTRAELPIETRVEQAVEVALLAGLRDDGEWLTWGFEGGPVVRFIGQKLTANAADRLRAGGLETGRTREGLGAGLTLGARAGVRLGPFDLGPAVNGTALVVRESGALAVRFDVAPGLGLGLAF